jgi:hypothetical protein
VNIFNFDNMNFKRASFCCYVFWKKENPVLDALKCHLATFAYVVLMPVYHL